MTNCEIAKKLLAMAESCRADAKRSPEGGERFHLDRAELLAEAARRIEMLSHELSRLRWPEYPGV